MGGSFGVEPRFTIIDQQDQKMILGRIMKEMNLDLDTYKPEKYAALINRAKDRLLSAEETEKELFSTDPLFYDVYREYERRLKRENLFDFGDLIYRLCRGLDTNDEALNTLKQRFRFILVDEFQDTNHAQYELIKKLTYPDGNIYVVGDEDQSIYGFRGAVIENILNFSKEYHNTKIIKLEENYRSFQTILSASSHLIDNNSGRFGKSLFTRKGKGEKIMFFRAVSDRAEARFIADRILRLRYDEGYAFSDIAVFYRMNAQSRVFESVFSELGIPYVIVGGFRFYEREEIKDILAYVKLLVNPHDEVSLRRIANKPTRGIGEKTVDALLRSTIGRGRPFFHIDETLEVSQARKKKIESFVESMKSLREIVDSTYPPDFLQTLCEATGYLDYLKVTGNEERLQNIEELYNAVEEFSKQNPSAPISEFVEEVSLNQNNSDESVSHNSSQRKRPRVSRCLHRGNGGRYIPALPRGRKCFRPSGGEKALLRRDDTSHGEALLHRSTREEALRNKCGAGRFQVYSRAASRSGYVQRTTGTKSSLRFCRAFLSALRIFTRTGFLTEGKNSREECGESCGAVRSQNFEQGRSSPVRPRYGSRTQG
jgi:DNA helicase-2/ATP-dependent DNA helicase PcrA